MPLQGDQLQWLLDTTRELNAQIIKISAITAGHAMALKILGIALTISIGGLISLAVEVLKK